MTAPQHGSLRIVMQQRSSKDGTIMRSWKGGPPNGTNMGKFFVLRAWQDGEALPVEINYDKVIWSGLSWAVGEIKLGELKAAAPITVQCVSREDNPVVLEDRIYAVDY
jgi:hypothetical protein